MVNIPSSDLQTSVVFVVENTSLNGAYIQELKANYVLPTLEYFNQGPIEDSDYACENTNSSYGIVVYKTADCRPKPCCRTVGHYTNAQKVISAFESIEMNGGNAETYANIAEGLATALQYFEDIQELYNPIQRYCILICNLPPYLVPVRECSTFAGKTVDQIAILFSEKAISLSILSARKLPALLKLFEKAGGDLQASLNKNYAKDPRHLILLNGYSLKERPTSPLLPPSHVTVSVASPAPNVVDIGSPATSSVNVSFRQPAPGTMSIVSNQQSLLQVKQQLQSVSAVGGPPTPNPQLPIQGQHPQLSPQMVQQISQQQPGGIYQQQMGNMPRQQSMYNQSPGMRGPPMMAQARWAQRPYIVPNSGSQPNSALIAQLTQPPTSLSQFPPQRMETASSGANVSAINNPMLQSQTPQQQSQQLQQQFQHQQQQLHQQQQMQQHQLQQQLQQQQMQKQQQQALAMRLMGPNSNMLPMQMQSSPQLQQQQSQPPSGNLNPPPTGGVLGSVGTQMISDRHVIWTGALEWTEKMKVTNDNHKYTHQVPCQVTANAKDGEPEIKADSWPQKLIMQLMPKQLISNIGNLYLKNSISVLFHPQNCEALDALTKVMSNGYAGCLHFNGATTASSDIKVLILLYTTCERRAFLGFIPNDQAAFVDRLRKLIHQQRFSGVRHPGPNAGGPLSNMPMQQNIMPPPNMTINSSQTGNIVGMSGSPMTQGGAGPPSVTSGVSAAATSIIQTQSGQSQSGPPGMQQSTNSGVQISSIGAGPGPRGNAPMGNCPPFNDQLEVKRQQNLAKIQELQQTLQAAQQQELQYKSQMEIMNHLPQIEQVQQALESCQQQDNQYKMLEQHPQYRQLLLQQQMSNRGGHVMQPTPQNNNQLEDVNFDLFNN